MQFLESSVSAGGFCFLALLALVFNRIAFNYKIERTYQKAFVNWTIENQYHVTM